ncbi:MAG: hypothetical protein ACJ749_10650 [Flavisolibacter sp.]
MNEQEFYRVINTRSKELDLNPLLILSGIEGLYTFKDVKLSAINYDFLDSLILTIFELRIGDKFHALAEENLSSANTSLRNAAGVELAELSNYDIASSHNPYLQSFAKLLDGKSPIRKYHEKALEVAALEIKKAQLIFGNDSIGIIMLAICKEDVNSLGLAGIFTA